MDGGRLDPSAAPGEWNVEGVEFAYQWKVNGVAVSTGKTFRLEAKHVGSKVALTVTANAPGHLAAVANTKPITVAKFGSRVNVTTAKVLNDRRVALGVRLKSLGSLKGGKVFVLEVAGPDRAIVARFPAVATNSGTQWDHTFTLPKAKKGTHTYLVDFKGTNTVERSAGYATVTVK